jgi:hypothetical protein
MADGATNPQQIPASLEIPARRNSLGSGRMEPISHERAQEAALRLIHSHFGTKPHARVHIPVDADDDDVVLMDYIQQQVAKEMGLR